MLWLIIFYNIVLNADTWYLVKFIVCLNLSILCCLPVHVILVVCSLHLSCFDACLFLCLSLSRILFCFFAIYVCILIANKPRHYPDYGKDHNDADSSIEQVDGQMAKQVQRWCQDDYARQWAADFENNNRDAATVYEGGITNRGCTLSSPLRACDRKVCFYIVSYRVSVVIIGSQLCWSCDLLVAWLCL